MNKFLSFGIILLLSTPFLLLAQLGVLSLTPQGRYVCYQTADSMVMDGVFDEDAWQAVPWTTDFVDIEGEKKPLPTYRTRMKMLWDDTYLYLAVEMEEPHLWATLTERESIIFQDNDFELFLDPDGDGHAYYEWEVNALGTEWDLMLLKAYRDGGPAVTGWDISGLKKGIKLNGTLNDPSDIDEGWTVEVALPWKILAECAPNREKPRDGDQWRANFSRVQWDLEVDNQGYKKQVSPSTQKPLPEHNWVWSPPGLISMHMPELWGWVQFSKNLAGQEEVAFREDRNANVKRDLWEVYYAQSKFYEENGYYAGSLEELELTRMLVRAVADLPQITTTGRQFEAKMPAHSGKGNWFIRQNGRIFFEK